MWRGDGTSTQYCKTIKNNSNSWGNWWTNLCSQNVYEYIKLGLWTEDVNKTIIKVIIYWPTSYVVHNVGEATQMNDNNWATMYSLVIIL